MPEKAALLAVLMMERPLCITCLVKKSGLTAAEVAGDIARMQRTVDVHRGTDQCRACGASTAVYSLRRQD